MRKGWNRKVRLGVSLFVLCCGMYLLTGCGAKAPDGAADTGQEEQTAQQGNGQQEQEVQDAGNQPQEEVQTQGTETQTEAAGKNAQEQDVTIVSEPFAEASGDSMEKETDSVQDDAEAEEKDKITMSIMGDSISTFDEWIPEGYIDYYPFDGEVSDVNETWWKMVLDDMGFALCVNASSSGSTCIGESPATDSPKHGCSEFRTSGLADENGNAPDIIVVYMGTNDFLIAMPLGDNDGTRHVEEGFISDFSDAYCLMLDKIAANYPDAQIFCCNLTPVGNWKDGSLRITTNGLGLTSEDYSRQIEIIAAAKGYPVIDLKNCGITDENIDQYTSDGVHLKPEGMKLVRDAAEAVLKIYY